MDHKQLVHLSCCQCGAGKDGKVTLTCNNCGEIYPVINDDKANKQWTIIDTFDMYLPTHDYPHSEHTVRDWFKEIGFEQVYVGHEPNGVVGRGIRPSA